MFKLLKWTAYAAIGYVLYELFIGMTQEQPSMGGGSEGRRPEIEKALNKEEGRMGVLTGEGRGTNVQTEEASGASMSHPVGRGVTT